MRRPGYLFNGGYVTMCVTFVRHPAGLDAPASPEASSNMTEKKRKLRLGIRSQRENVTRVKETLESFNGTEEFGSTDHERLAWAGSLY
ncbi:hypothetical protein N7539_005939 [Penicillium diatomitis]|uniref:Uncharacterized protein n=1 Tax=Penicillium diatomitis TaxID=2819901 RepID=A0A9W9X5A0_9EURO|nr:uncharacterized protein N7539_005939 [Penicillium diatomitis]KAJ5484143.1 hypothetical protein N7539_005939 [Penicillium diatomitis]